MIIGHRTIKVTDTEFDTLGSALEEYLREEIKSFSGLRGSFNSIESIHHDDLDLLHSFLTLGYSLYIRGKRYDDAWEWAKAIHEEVCKQKN